MSVKVEQQVDDPIVNITFTGQLDAETLAELDAQTAKLLEEMGTYYAILDVRGFNITGEIGDVIEKIAAQTVLLDPRITLVVVGRGVGSSSQTSPIFADKEAATDHIRQLIAQNASGQS